MLRSSSKLVGLSNLFKTKNLSILPSANRNTVKLFMGYKPSRFFSSHTDQESKIPGPMCHHESKHKKDCEMIDDYLGYETFQYIKSENSIHQHLSMRLNSTGTFSKQLIKLGMNDRWATFYKLNRHSDQIISEEIDDKLGEIPKEILSWAGYISVRENAGVEQAVARQRIATE